MNSTHVRGIVLCILSFGFLQAHGEAVTTVTSTRRVFTSSDLPTLRSAGIEEVGFWVEQYRIDWKSNAPVREQGFGTKFYAWYHTQHPNKLRDFVFVQFIRGCTYETREVDGSVAMSQPKVRTFFGNQGVSFNHHEWVIDSTDADPAYWSDPGYTDRHALLRWGISETSFPDRPGDYPMVVEQQPSEPRVFITDYPQGGDIRWNRWTKSVVATNSAFRFRTCLFKAEDVPTQAQPNTPLPQPLVCMWWESLYVYDHHLQKMASPEDAVSVCRAPSNTDTKQRASS